MTPSRVARSRRYQAGVVLTTAAALAIAVATLRPGFGGVRALSLFCIFCGEFGLVDIILNVLLFVPFGAGLQLMRARRPIALPAIVAVPVIIELLQATVIRGRYATLHDVLFNSIGAALGIWLVANSQWLLRPAPGRARGMALLAAFAWLGVLAGTGWAVAVVLPDGTYHWRLATRLRGFHVFPGTVADARMAGDPVPVAPDEAADVRARLAVGTGVEATVIPAAPTGGFAPIVHLMSPSGAKVMMIGQDGTDLVFAALMRASRLRLRSPSVKIEGALGRRGASEVGAPVRVRATIRGGSLQLEAVSSSRRQRTLPLTVALGWTLVLPTRSPLGESTAFISAVWLALIALPVGYYAGWMVAPTPHAPRGSDVWIPGSLSLIVIVLGLGLTPLVTSTPAVGPIGWLGAVAGVAMGWCASTLLRARAAKTAFCGDSATYAASAIAIDAGQIHSP